MERADSYSDRSGGVKWSVMRLPKPGENICGDRFIVKRVGNSVLVGVLDGLGHGEEAARAGKEAITVLEAQPTYDRLEKLYEDVHRALVLTRGVVMSLAVFDIDHMEFSWLGVGNIKGVFLRKDTNGSYKQVDMAQWGGVLGYRLPEIAFNRIHTYKLNKGDKLIFATDGIDDKFMDGVYPSGEPDHIVNFVSKRYFLNTDDALILVAQYEGNDVEQ